MQSAPGTGIAQTSVIPIQRAHTRHDRADTIDDRRPDLRIMFEYARRDRLERAVNTPDLGPQPIRRIAECFDMLMQGDRRLLGGARHLNISDCVHGHIGLTPLFRGSCGNRSQTLRLTCLTVVGARFGGIPCDERIRLISQRRDMLVNEPIRGPPLHAIRQSTAIPGVRG